MAVPKSKLSSARQNKETFQRMEADCSYSRALPKVR